MLFIKPSKKNLHASETNGFVEILIIDSFSYAF